MQATQSGTNASTLTVNANSYGRASVYFQLPNVSDTQCQITCVPGNYSVSGTYFTESSDNGTGTYPSPNFNPQPVPVQSYPALDVTGGVASGTICAIALNDDNTGAFATGCGGDFTMSQTFNLGSNSSGTANSWQQNIELGTPPGSSYSWSFWIGTLAPNGTVYGVWNVNAHVNNYGLECQNSHLTVADDGEYNGTVLPTSNGDKSRPGKETHRNNDSCGPR